jgi:E3 ubiquitin-protein ligase SIAH1
MKEGVDLPGGDDDGKGPSSPRPKRLRISVQSNAVDGDDREFQGSFSDCFNPNREQKGKHCEDEGEQETYEEEERYSDDEEGEHEEEESYSDDEEGGHEEEEEGYSDDEEEDPGSTVTVRPRSNGGAQVGRDGSISVTLTDPEVLDCYICFEHLSSPVFQVSSLLFSSSASDLSDLLLRLNRDS